MCIEPNALPTTPETTQPEPTGTPASSSRRDALRRLAASGAACAIAPLAGCAVRGTSAAPVGGGKTHPLPQSIAAAARDLRAQRYSCEELTRAYLDGIAQFQPQLDAFITITASQALAQARSLDQELRAGHDRGPLHGIPIVHKDLYDTRGIRTTVGSAFFQDRVPQTNATVVERLAQAGAVMLGKTNMNEFAAGITGTNEFFGNIHNPWNLARSPGGSSSGTGAAVAAGLCLGGTGSDTGGSIRVPCCWDGLTGIRPSFGRVSLTGVFPRSYSLDCAGPLSRSAADVATLLSAMAGYDSTYKYSLRVAGEDFGRSIGKPVRGLRLGIIQNYTYRDVDPDVAAAIEAATRALQEQGMQIVPINIPFLSKPFEFSSLFTILLYEFNQILGQRYRAAPDKSLFGSIVRSDLAKGEKISRRAYEKALANRAPQVRQFHASFERVDALITPAMPNVAPPLATGGPAYDRGRQFTLPISWTGFPALAAPCGFGAQGLPVGMQLIGRPLQEALLLQIAAAYEQATGFDRRRAPLQAEAMV